MYKCWPKKSPKVRESCDQVGIPMIIAHVTAVEYCFKCTTIHIMSSNFFIFFFFGGGGMYTNLTHLHVLGGDIADHPNLRQLPKHAHCMFSCTYMYMFNTCTFFYLLPRHHASDEHVLSSYYLQTLTNIYGTQTSSQIPVCTRPICIIRAGSIS